MLDNGKGLMFMPNEPQRAEIKRRTHALNQKYNALTEADSMAKKSEILGDCKPI